MLRERLPPPPGHAATPASQRRPAAWVIELCGHLQQAIWLAYGDQIESHWTWPTHLRALATNTNSVTKTLTSIQVPRLHHAPTVLRAADSPVPFPT